MKNLHTPNDSTSQIPDHIKTDNKIQKLHETIVNDFFLNAKNGDLMKALSSIIKIPKSMQPAYFQKYSAKCYALYSNGFSLDLEKEANDSLEAIVAGYKMMKKYNYFPNQGNLSDLVSICDDELQKIHSFNQQQQPLDPQLLDDYHLNQQPLVAYLDHDMNKFSSPYIYHSPINQYLVEAKEIEEYKQKLNIKIKETQKELTDFQIVKFANQELFIILTQFVKLPNLLIFQMALDLDLDEWFHDFITKNNIDSSLPKNCFKILLEHRKKLADDVHSLYHPEDKAFTKEILELIIKQPTLDTSTELFNKLIEYSKKQNIFKSSLNCNDKILLEQYNIIKLMDFAIKNPYFKQMSPDNFNDILKLKLFEFVVRNISEHSHKFPPIDLKYFNEIINNIVTSNIEAPLITKTYYYNIEHASEYSDYPLQVFLSPTNYEDHLNHLINNIVNYFLSISPNKYNIREALDCKYYKTVLTMIGYYNDNPNKGDKNLTKDIFNKFYPLTVKYCNQEHDNITLEIYYVINLFLADISNSIHPKQTITTLGNNSDNSPHDDNINDHNISSIFGLDNV
ncbi:MAG: hypothetical protein HRU35_07655 [Rickettsiaceae bacterium]|nr:hypothetical protein [Rickettsiaceae bacterium]